MGKKNKLKKFEDLHLFPNVYENFDFTDPSLYISAEETVDIKGRWSSDHFGNNAPITLELACGGGEYTVALAQKYPNRNFIGVDIKGARIWKGASQALYGNLVNAAFLRCRIEKVMDFIGNGEISEIWITFPDPFLKKSQENRRLTSPVFLQRYLQFLKDGAVVHLKTDDDTLYEYTLSVVRTFKGAQLLKSSADIYNGDLPAEELEFKTYYEKMHLTKGKSIKYVSFQLFQEPSQQ